MAENPSPEPTPVDISQARPLFNELSVLFPILAFYTVGYLALMAADFLLKEAFVFPAGISRRSSTYRSGARTVCWLNSRRRG